MSYQVLARKWRPRLFSEIVEQEHVTRALINGLNQNRLHHAYLFTGTRGVGKTTLARIFAKCLNCETGVSATPCGKCNTCLEIDEGRFIDLIEVDAASRTKVEDTRELLDNVQYAPTCGRYKVYLIDEVHMLSGHSFNALLKTLEEPPQHVKFLLATTEPQKLPITVLSRCLQFNLKNISPEKTAEHLAYILEQEKIEYENAALSQLTKAADGSIRDALSLLDQAIAYGNNKITTVDVRAMLGTIEDTHLFQILTALAKNNASEIFNITNNLASQSADFASVLEELLSLLHRVALARVLPNDEITAIASLLSPKDIQLYYQIALIGRRDLPLAPTPKTGFEMIMLRMLAFRPVAALENKEPKTKSLETDLIPRNPQDEAEPVLCSSKDEAGWQHILPQLKISGPTKALATHCSLEKFTDDGQIQLLLNIKHAPLLHAKHEERLNFALSNFFNKPITTKITIVADNLETPSAINAKKNQEKQQKAIETMNNDPNVQSMIKNFGATLIPDSVTTNQ